MPFELPQHFANNINHLGSLIWFCDNVKNEDLRRDYLQTGITASCSILTELNRLRNSMQADFDGIKADVSAAAALVIENKNLFMSIEDIILRDSGINEITRKIMINNVRRIEAFDPAETRDFNGSSVVGALDNLRTEICDRAEDLAKDSGAMFRFIEGTVTYAMAPINVAVAFFHPAFLPIVFKASGWAGTVAAKSITWR